MEFADVYHNLEMFVKTLLRHVDRFGIQPFECRSTKAERGIRAVYELLDLLLFTRNQPLLGDKVRELVALRNALGPASARSVRNFELAVCTTCFLVDKTYGMYMLPIGDPKPGECDTLICACTMAFVAAYMDRELPDPIFSEPPASMYSAAHDLLLNHIPTEREIAPAA